MSDSLKGWQNAFEEIRHTPTPPAESRESMVYDLTAPVPVKTPPAQEAEPVYQRRFANYDEAAWFDVSRAEFDAENVIEKRIVYTHPANDKLRQAAEAVADSHDMEDGHLEEAIERLNEVLENLSALEGKS